MFLELAITTFVAAYIVLVAVGHVLLFAAILKYLREDTVRGRAQETAAGQRSSDGAVNLLRPSARKVALAHTGRHAEHWEDSAHAGVVRDFATQRQALSRDLRYVVTVTGSKC